MAQWKKLMEKGKTASKEKEYSANLNNTELTVPSPYIARQFKPIRPYLTAPTITRRKKSSPSAPPAPSPHASAPTEFRFYEGLGPYQGDDLVVEEDLLRTSPRSQVPRTENRWTETGKSHTESTFVEGRMHENRWTQMGPEPTFLEGQGMLENPWAEMGRSHTDPIFIEGQNITEGDNSLLLNIDIDIPPTTNDYEGYDGALSAYMRESVAGASTSSPNPPAPHPYPTDKNRLTIIYSYPHHGSTSAFANLMKKTIWRHSDRWVRYLNLKKASRILEKTLRSSWTLSKLIISYFQLTEQAEILRVQRFFFESDRNRDDDGRRVKKKPTDEGNDLEIVADLFLDELDEMRPDTLETMLHILRKIDWKSSSARVWVSARAHLKPRIDETVVSYLVRGDTWRDESMDCYEMLPISKEEQIAYLYQSWKCKIPNAEKNKFTQSSHLTELEPDDYDPLPRKLKSFVSGLYCQLESEIPQFYKTLGACPFHLNIVKSHFEEDMKQYFAKTHENDHKYRSITISMTKLLADFIQAKFDCFMKNQIIWGNQPTNSKLEEFMDNLFQKVSRLHTKLAITSFDQSYTCDGQAFRQMMSNQLDDEHELFLMGIITETNGETKFLHEMLVDFLLAQYFVDYGREKYTSVLYMQFFLNNILYHDKCTRVRKYFDEYLTLQQNRKKMRGSIIWLRLRQFLVQHYFLDDDHEVGDCEDDEATKYVLAGFDYGNTGNGEHEHGSCSKPDSSQASTRSKRMTRYDLLRKRGTVLHLAIIEGNMKLAQLLIDSFKGSTEQLRKFLNISVLLQLDKGYTHKLSPPTPKTLSKVLHVTTIQVLALFGKDKKVMEQMVPLVLSSMDSNLRNASFQTKTWTALHFAAMNSNWEFLHALFSGSNSRGKVDVNAICPTGSSPLHMVLISNSWFYTMVIFDPPHPNTGKGNAEKSPPPSKKQKKPKSVKKEDTPVDENLLKLEFARKIWKHQGVIKRFYKIDEYSNEELNDPCGRHIKTMDVLLKNGAILNERQTINKTTVMHQAAQLESPTMMNYLLEKGGDPNAKDKMGNTPSFYQENSSREPAPIPGRLEFPTAMPEFTKRTNRFCQVPLVVPSEVPVEPAVKLTFYSI